MQLAVGLREKNYSIAVVWLIAHFLRIAERLSFFCVLPIGLHGKRVRFFFRSGVRNHRHRVYQRKDGQAEF